MSFRTRLGLLVAAAQNVAQTQDLDQPIEISVAHREGLAIVQVRDRGRGIAAPPTGFEPVPPA